MKIQPKAYLPTPAPTPKRRAASVVPVTQQPHFRGVGDVVAKVVGFIQSSLAVELAATDLGGMVLPRTAADGWFRGPDTAIETFFREFGGTFTLVFTMGWIGLLALKAYGTKAVGNLLGLNPKGMYAKSWVNGESLHAFQTIFEKALAESTSALDARDRFLGKVVSGLRSTDPHVAHATAKYFERKDPVLAARLKDMKEAGLAEGKALPGTVDRLKAFFHIQEDPWVGILPIDAKVRAQVGSTADAKAVNQARFKMSELAFQSEQALLEKIDHTAAEGILTNVVNLTDETGMVLVKKRPRMTLFKELKHHLEQFVDRALADPATGRISAQAFAHAETEKQAILNRLTQPAEKGFLKSILPKLEEGLLPYAYKTKRFLVLIPFLLSIGVAIGYTFFNNWLTKMRNGGQSFFPGEHVFAQQKNKSMSAQGNTPLPFSVSQVAYNPFLSAPGRADKAVWPQQSQMAGQGGPL